MYAAPSSLDSLSTRHREIVFADETLWLDADGALFWPERELLVVSDLHLEKGSFLGRLGTPLPRYDTRATLEKLEAALLRYKPRSVLCLGDSFHDRAAFERLDAEDARALIRLVEGIAAWHWVLGNHDPHLDAHLPGQRHTHWQEGGLTFHHQPPPEWASGPLVIGHFHPKLTWKLVGQRVTGPAFVCDTHLLIMPAFGSFTGGLDVKHESLACLLRDPEYFLLKRERVWRVPKA